MCLVVENEGTSKCVFKATVRITRVPLCLVMQTEVDNQLPDPKKANHNGAPTLHATLRPFEAPREVFFSFCVFDWVVCETIVTLFISH